MTVFPWAAMGFAVDGLHARLAENALNIGFLICVRPLWFVIGRVRMGLGESRVLAGRPDK